MVQVLINWLIYSLAILVAAYLLPGVDVANFFVALVLAVVLGLINAIIKPILLLITLPINILTLGLFTLVINAAMIMLADYLVPGFTVANFWWALLFSLVLSLINWLLHSMTAPAEKVAKV